jgi:hypothetical protein
VNSLRPFLCSALAVLMIGSSSSGCESDYPIWIPRSATADPLYRFTKGRKAGYIDQTGKVVIPPVISVWGGNGDGEFHDGLLEISVSDGVYVDVTGKKGIHKRFYRGCDFSEGLAAAMEKDGGTWGYINTKGDFVISPRFASSPMDYVWSFEGGLAKIEVAGKFGYIDHTGEFAIPPRLLDGDSFHAGMARVIVEGPCGYFREESPCPDLGVVPKGTKTQESLPACKYTFIDKSGHVISEQRYDYALPFAGGLAPVRIGKLWGYIDKTGMTVIAPRFDSASSFADGLGLVSENGLFGYVDRTGAYTIKPQFKSAESFVEGRAVVGSLESGYWYIDQSGKPAITEKFAVASPFFKGLAQVKVLSNAARNRDVYSGTFAYIDRSGKRVFEYNP